MSIREWFLHILVDRFCVALQDFVFGSNMLILVARTAVPETFSTAQVLSALSDYDHAGLSRWYRSSNSTRPSWSA